MSYAIVIMSIIELLLMMELDFSLHLDVLIYLEKESETRIYLGIVLWMVC